LILAGTAGTYSSQAVVGLADFSPTPIIRVVGRKSHKNYRSTAESLLKVRDTFGFKMSELAEIFGVSRTAAYDWLNGSTPKAEIAMRIETLALYADSLRESENNFGVAPSRRPALISGRALVKGIKTGQSFEESLESLKQISALPQKSRFEMLGSQRAREQKSTTIDEILTPAIFERA